MTRRKWGFKPSKSQQQRSFAIASNFYAAAADKPGVEIPTVRKRRSVDNSTVARPLEADVVSACAELLAIHPKVLFAVRQNSGAASYEASSGKWAPVWFYKVVTRQPVTITDFWGILRDGRMLAIECKRPGWREPRGDREMRQALFLSLVQNCGGVGGFVTCINQLKEMLDGVAGMGR